MLAEFSTVGQSATQLDNIVNLVIGRCIFPAHLGLESLHKLLGSPVLISKARRED